MGSSSRPRSASFRPASEADQPAAQHHQRHQDHALEPERGTEDLPHAEEHLGDEGHLDVAPGVELSEPRQHHVEDHPQGDDQHHHQEGGVEQGLDDASAAGLGEFLEGQPAGDHIRQGAAALAGHHVAAVDGGEGAGLLQGVGEGHALPHQFHHLREAAAQQGILAVAHQQFQGLQQRNAGLQQGQQLLVEEHQGFGLELGPAAEGRVRALDLQGEAPLGQHPGLQGLGAVCLEVPDQDLAVGMGELDREAHGHLGSFEDSGSRVTRTPQRNASAGEATGNSRMARKEGPIPFLWDLPHLP